ncbi:hypothetical protein MMC17_000861 [Xylographa soralifera]|nr:hypothetical protein [Xylographa soralifera]
MKEAVVATTDTAEPHRITTVHPVPYETHHKTALSTITVLAFLTRFCGLSHPSEVVFDEAHIMRFTSWYLTRTYFFDLHPPFGRLLYAFLGWVMGYDGHFVPYEVGESYITNEIPYLAFRAMPALLSTFTVSVVYLIMWESGYALPACVVAAGLVLLDNAHISQTRLIYLDAILVFSMACSLLCYIKFSKLKDQAFSKKWWIWLILTGLALSCGISTKYVGLFGYMTIGTAVMIELWELFDITSNRVVSMLEFLKHVTARAFALVIIPFILYLFWFYVHFAILTRSGSGDDYMSEGFVETLSSNATLEQGPKSLSFFQKWFELQGLMFEYNGLLDTKHPYESRPWQWPFSLGGVSFWESEATRQQVFFVGNIAGWWIASSALVVFVSVIVVDRLFLGRGLNLVHDRARHRLCKSAGFFALAWATHYFPFFLMSRQMMLHTYLPAHLASTLVTGALVEFFFDSRPVEEEPTETTPNVKEASGQTIHLNKSQAPRSQHTSRRFAGSSTASWIACGSILGVTFAFWCFWLPLTYGYPGLSMEGVQRRQILGYRLHFAYDYAKYLAEYYAQYGEEQI